ncbi:Protein dachsous [Trichinella spiralis]
MSPIKIVVGARTADMASFLASTLIVLVSYEPYIVKVVRNDTATVSIIGQTNYVAIPSRAPFSVPVRMVVFKDRQPYYEWQVWTDGNGHFETVYIENYQDYGVFSVLAIHPGKTLLLNVYSPYFTDPRVSWCVYYVQLIGPSKVTNCNVNQQCRAEIVIKTTPTHELTNFTLAISNDQTATAPELVNAPSIMHIPKKSVLSIPLVFVFREPLEGNVRLVARADGKPTIAKLDIPFKVMSQSVHVHIKPTSLHFLSCNGMFGNIRNSIQIYNYGLVPITNLELSCASDQCPVFISSIVLENQLPEQQSDMLLPGQSACLNFEVSNSKKDSNITTDVHLLHNINLRKDIPLIIVSLPEPCWTLKVVVYSFEVFASDAMLKTAIDTVIEVKNVQLQYNDVQEANSDGNQFSLPSPGEYVVQISKLGYDALRQVVSVRFAERKRFSYYKFSIEQKNNLILMEPPLFTMNMDQPKTSVTVRLKNQAHVTLENIYFDEKNIETTTVVAFLNPHQATAVELKLNFNYTSDEFLLQMQQCNLLCLPLRYEFTVDNQLIQMEECFLLQFSQPSVEDPTVCRVELAHQMPVQIPLTIRNELPCSCGYVAVSECLSLYSTTGSCGEAVEMITSIPGLGMILEMLQLINACSRSYIDLDLVDRVINCVMSSGYNCLNTENTIQADNNSDIYNQFNDQSISPKKDFFSAYARFFSLMRTILSMPRLYWSDSHWFSMFKKFISETSENEESLSVRELKALSETVGNFQQSYQLGQALKLWNTTAGLLRTGKSLPAAPYSFPWNEMILFANLKDALQKLATKLNAKNAFELLDQSLVTLSKSENATRKKSLAACLVGGLSFSTVSMYENDDAAVQLTIQNLNPNKLENVTVKLILMSVGSMDNVDNNVNMQLGNATAFGFDHSNNIGPNDQTAAFFGQSKRSLRNVYWAWQKFAPRPRYNSNWPALGPSVIIAINNIGYSAVEELRLENVRPLFGSQDPEEQLTKPFVRKALLDQTNLQPQWNQRIRNIRPGQVVHLIYFLDPSRQWTFDRFTYEILVNGNTIPAVESRRFFALHYFHENDHHQHHQHQQISAALLTDDDRSSAEVPKYFYIFANGQLLPVINVQPVTTNYCMQSVDHCLLEANVTGSGAGVLYGRLELPFKLNANMSLVSATVNQVCTGPWHVWTTDLSPQSTLLHFALPNWSGSDVTKLTLVFGLPSREPIYFLHDQYNQTLDRCTPVGSTIFQLLALCVNHSNEAAKVTYSLKDTYGVLSIDPLTAEIKLRRPLTDIGQVNEMSIQVTASSPTQTVPTASTMLHLFIVDNITTSHRNFTTTVGTVCITEEEPPQQPTITVDQTQLPEPEPEVDWTSVEGNSTTTVVITDEQEALLQPTEYTTNSENETVTTATTLSTLSTMNPFDNSNSSSQNGTTVNYEFQSTEFQELLTSTVALVTDEIDHTADWTNNMENTTQTVDEQNNETETGLISETLVIVTNTAPTSDLIKTTTNSDNQMTLDEIISLACKLRTSKSLWAIICDLGRIKT